MSVFKSALITFSKVLFPNRCELCGEVIALDRKVCKSCENPPVIQPPLCEYCGSSETECSCKKHKHEYKQIVAPYYYRDSLVYAIHRYKNSEMLFLADRLSEDIYKCVKAYYGDISFDMITYVPLRKLRQRKRGFNQSELLARKISEKLGAPALPLLVKIRYTGVQHHKSAMERKADVFGSYDVSDKYKNRLDGKTILLIDDVKTTGSTLNECAKMLKIYGAKSVYCAVAAIANNKRQQP